MMDELVSIFKSTMTCEDIVFKNEDASFVFKANQSKPLKAWTCRDTV